jgi:hypothetical protein
MSSDDWATNDSLTLHSQRDELIDIYVTPPYSEHTPIPHPSYAIFKAFDAFKKRNKLTGRVRSIWAYFPFRIIVPPACLSVGVVPLLKMFTRLRIGVDLAFTCYYSVALCIHLIAINESTIKQYMQLRLAEVVVIEPVSTVTPSRTR